MQIFWVLLATYGFAWWKKFRLSRQNVCHALYIPSKNQKIEVLPPFWANMMHDSPHTQNFEIRNSKGPYLSYKFWLKMGKWKFCSVNFIVELIWRHLSSIIWVQEHLTSLGYLYLLYKFRQKKINLEFC
jgi:hypothetical protein